MLTSALEVVGVAFLVAAAVVAFGLAGALAASGVVLLLAAYVMERRA